MSNDLVLLSLDQNLQLLAALRGGPPLFAAIACAGEVGVVDWSPFSTGAGGHTYARAVYTESAVAEPDRGAAWRAFLTLGQRMSGLIRELPDDARRRLGTGELFGTRCTTGSDTRSG